jgi:hypothetical protein
VLSKRSPLNLTSLSPSKASQTFARLPRTMAESEADLGPALLSAHTLATAIDGSERMRVLDSFWKTFNLVEELG